MYNLAQMDSLLEFHLICALHPFGTRWRSRLANASSERSEITLVNTLNILIQDFLEISKIRVKILY